MLADVGALLLSLIVEPQALANFLIEEWAAGRPKRKQQPLPLFRQQ